MNEYMIAAETLSENGRRILYNGMGELFNALETHYPALLASQERLTAICELGRERSTEFVTEVGNTGLSVVRCDLSLKSLGLDLFREVEEARRMSPIKLPGMSANIMFQLLKEATVTPKGLIIPGYGEDPITHLVGFTNLVDTSIGSVYRLLTKLLPKEIDECNFMIHEVTGDTGLKFNALNNFVNRHRQ